jgi:hypothetical protein
VRPAVRGSYVKLDSISNAFTEARGVTRIEGDGAPVVPPFLTVVRSRG